MSQFRDVATWEVEMRLHLVVATTLLTACAGTAPTSEPTNFNGRITTESEFSLVVGRRLTRNADFVVINADGTFTGRYSDVVASGTWEFRDGFFCRIVLQGPSGPDPEDCQTSDLQGNTLTFTRDRGTGGTVVYTVS
jgi:hypothetical protein